MQRSFPLELSDAIESATASLRQDSPDAFCHDDADLAGAVERETFVRLVNRRDLALAFARGEGRVELDDAYEVRVARNLVPRARITIPGSRRARSRARPLAREIRSRLTRPPAMSAKRRPIWLVVHHPKFLRFSLPIVEALGRQRVGVVSLATAVTAAAQELGLAVVELPRPAPVGRTQTFGGRVHLADLFVTLRSTLARGGAEVVVVFEGNAPVDDVSQAAAAALGIASVCVQHGWAAETNVGFRNLRHTAFAVWGEGFAELLAPYSPEQAFVATGNPTLDAVAATEPTQADGGILFALQTVAPTISAATMAEFVALIQDAAVALPHLPMLVREHPAHPLARVGLTVPDLPNIVRVDAPDTSLAQALSASVVVASISSTTLLEGVAVLRPALMFTGDGPRYVPDLEALGVGVEGADRRQAVERLRELVQHEEREQFRPAMEIFRQRYFSGALGDAAVQIARVIQDFTC